MSDFKLVGTCSGVAFEKDGKRFAVAKGIDGDVWFETRDTNLSMDIDFHSRNRSEWRSYSVFEDLLEHIIGKFILRGDTLGEYPLRYADFIDFDNKTITWHSDSGTDNVLKISYDERKVTVEIIKDAKASSNTNNSVRIRTDGSEYGTYYQQFDDFYKDMCRLEREVNPKVEAPVQKKKTFLDRFRGRK